MKTLDLTGKRITLDKLLELAAAGSVRIVTADGHAFILEKADDFENEVALLGKSKAPFGGEVFLFFGHVRLFGAYWTTISLNSTALTLAGATARLTRRVSSSRSR